jgi:DNA-binding Lrp family transcriptional regulator
MIITALDKRILATIELNAELNAADIARIAGTTAQAVYRRISRLIDNGVIVGKTAVIDLSQLGLTEFGFNLSIAPKDLTTKKRFIDAIKRCPHITWIAEVGGEFDLMCNLIASTPVAAHRILENTLSNFADTILKRQVCARFRRYRFPRWFLGPRRPKEQSFLLGAAAKVQLIDDLDRKVLSAISKIKFESIRDISQSSGVPLSTLQRRISNLHARGILLGFGYRLDMTNLAVMQYRAQLTFRVITPAIRNKLVSIAKRERFIKLLIDCLGSWDIELEIDAPEGEDIKLITSRLHTEFHGELVNLTLIPILNIIQHVSFPVVEE